MENEVRVEHTPSAKKRLFPQVQKLRFEIVSSLYKEPIYRIVEKIKKMNLNFDGRTR